MSVAYLEKLNPERVSAPANAWCENTLAKSQAFRLPGRKAVVASERAFDIILIDATETPIERPKKTKTLLFGQEEAAHAENPARRRKIDAPHPLPLP